MRPPQHTRDADRPHPARHAGARGRGGWRDLGLAVLALAAAAGVVAGLLHADPTMRVAVLDLLGGVEAVARERVEELLRR